MNRRMFMTALERELRLLDEGERMELLSDYEQHFEMGLAEGKTEEDISRELGHPRELALEALGDRYAPPAQEAASPGFTYNNAYGASNNAGVPFTASMPYVTESRSSHRAFRSLFSAIGMFFLNLIFALPIFATVWSVWLAVALTSAAGILAPFLALADFMFQEQRVIWAEASVSITMLGIGILLSIFSLWAAKKLGMLTRSYVSWNVKVVKGRDQ
ncbi:DUF1700 domain-containing protein [Paenibacillus urinalis]|uniref:DUF1700 domain-containing protein n=1 Tax=Paenibacillus urinalis TaxID=521520 RepID=A0AAX3MYI3_9BACL|nr:MULTISPECIES: DUF1700 domain-containing protein [Paenibacillus]WDH82377.1 DUF1700 domain-containing protein [Paenibacillus urinalis]WDH98434.1 DUF1700 domain-containing protein [Paenibacillus urinalis]WDI02124.1 DUF1700 domain-containing protein [Paenibacillus urinalis]GAK40173.1 hypothetical protein TCA2_2663 [Paenibacillus sp. TCA20]